MENKFYSHFSSIFDLFVMLFLFFVTLDLALFQKEPKAYLFVVVIVIIFLLVGFLYIKKLIKKEELVVYRKNNGEYLPQLFVILILAFTFSDFLGHQRFIIQLAILGLLFTVDIVLNILFGEKKLKVD